MRKTIVLLALLFVSALSWAQSTLKDEMARVEKQYGVRFIYDASLNLGVPATQKATSLTEALSQLFANGEIQYDIKGSQRDGNRCIDGRDPDRRRRLLRG